MATSTTLEQRALHRGADLVLEGGGVKGIGLAGAVLALDEAGYRFSRVAGTSAGAIAAALIAALTARGRPVSDLRDILATVEYPKFESGNVLTEASGLLTHMGLHNGDYLVTWLGDALTQIGATKFGDLRLDDAGADTNLTEAQRYTLIVDVSDISRGRCVHLPWDFPAYGRPDIDEESIVGAVRASMAIPFFFRPVRFEAPAVDFGDQHFEKSKITWVDGGMLSNFPVEVFDRTDGGAARWPTLGIKLSARQTVVAPAKEIHGAVGEAMAALHTLVNNDERFYVPSRNADRTIFVDNAGIAATDFAITKAQQDTLFANGQSAAHQFLAKGDLGT
jgi:NTE family protein